MSNFGEQPISNERKDFDENQANLEEKKKAIAEAAEAGDFDKIAALAQEAKSLEGKKDELIGNAQEEAGKEENERKMYDEANAEDAERNMYDEAAAEDVAREQVKFAEETRLKAEEDAKKAAEILKKIQGGGAETPQAENAEPVVVENAESAEIETSTSEVAAEQDESAVEKDGFSPEVQKYIDEMPVESGMYMGNYLSSIPKELMDNDEFLLKVAEVNPAAVLDHASKNLKGNKEFVMALMKANPRAETDKVNYHQVDFYTIERESPDLLYDKDLALTLIKRGDDRRGRMSSMRAKMLEDPDVYNAVVEESIKDIIKQAQEVAVSGRGESADIPDFKLRDGDTLGGERWSMKNDKAFMEKAENAVKGIVDIKINEIGNMILEPKA